MPPTPVATLRVTLPPHRSLPGEKDVRQDLSVVEPVGDSLFVASDETATVERLTRQPDGTYAGHVPERLSAFFDLPLATEEDVIAGEADEAAERGEVDIEGFGYDDSTGYVWVTGSMSLARRRPKPDEHDDAESLERLTAVRRDPNRYLLGRIPCLPGGKGGEYDLVKEGKGKDGKTLTAACLKMSGKGGNALTKALEEDEHIGRFLGIPAKENGFDIEGLAAYGDRVWLGLRGPVLRGWATVIELQVAEKKGRLKLVDCGPDGAPYRKHFLDLDGLGIRDMKRQRDDLLILAGPTMDLDGPVFIYRWPGAVRSTEQMLVSRKELVRVTAIPHGIGFDHAEGIALLPRPDGPPRLLVAYDNPGAGRLHGDGVDLDVFDLP